MTKEKIKQQDIFEDVEFNIGEDPLIEMQSKVTDYAINSRPSKSDDDEYSQNPNTSDLENLPNTSESKLIDNAEKPLQEPKKRSRKKIIKEKVVEAQIEPMPQFEEPPSMVYDEDDDGLGESYQTGYSDYSNTANNNEDYSNSENLPIGNEDDEYTTLDNEQIDFGTDFIISLIQEYLPKGLSHYTKIDTTEIKKAEANNLLEKGIALKCEIKNEKDAEKLKLTKSQIESISKPLKQVVKKRNIGITPETALIISFVMLSVSMYMTVNEIKKGNNEILKAIRDEINSNKNKRKNDKEEEIILT